MQYRKLRIAWSVTCGIVCMLLILLWVRSYRDYDLLMGPLSKLQRFEIWSADGELYGCDIGPWKDTPQKWAVGTSKNQTPLLESVTTKTTRLGFGFARTPAMSCAILPHWIIVVSAAIFAFAPWTFGARSFSRFSLRALLITTALVAVGLGIIVWVAKS